MHFFQTANATNDAGLPPLQLDDEDEFGNMRGWTNAYKFVMVSTDVCIHLLVNVYALSDSEVRKNFHNLETVSDVFFLVK